MKFKNRDIEVISKSQVVISASNDGLHSAYHEITKERMENKGTIIFQCEDEKSLKILLSEFPGSYNKLSLISLENQREIPISISNGIDLMVFWFFSINIHIFFLIFQKFQEINFNFSMKKRMKMNIADTYSTYMKIIKKYLMNITQLFIHVVGPSPQKS